MYALRLLDQQHDAAGADAVGRLRGRRRHRHAGEHRPPHRRRHAAVRGGAQGRARDRLHHHLDHVLADRGVHPGAADGRHGRPRVPRIRGHDRGRHHHLRLRLADADADAVRAHAARPSRGRARKEADLRAARVRGMFNGWLRGYEWTLDKVFAYKPVMLLVTFATIVGTVGSTSSSRRASSRPRIPASLLVITEAATDISFEAMVRAAGQGCGDHPAGSRPSTTSIRPSASAGPIRPPITAACSSC